MAWFVRAATATIETTIEATIATAAAAAAVETP